MKYKVVLAILITVSIVLLLQACKTPVLVVQKPKAMACSLSAMPLGFSLVASMSVKDTNGVFHQWTGYPSPLGVMQGGIFTIASGPQCLSSNEPDVIMWEFDCGTNPPQFFFDKLPLNTFGFSRGPITIDCEHCTYDLGRKVPFNCGSNLQTTPNQ